MKRVLPLAATALAIALALFLAPGSGAAPSSRRPADPELAALLVRFDQVQASMRTLSAEFTKTTVSPLFKEPKVSRGHLYLRKPTSVLWEFTSPETMRFLISGTTYTGYYPERKRAERKDIQRHSEQIFRFLGVGQSSAELQRAYEVSLGRPGEDAKGTYVLVLQPRRRRVRRHLDDVRLSMDAVTHLPVRLAYHAASGAEETLAFRNVRLNPELSADLFHLELPPDVVVTTGFSVFGESEGPRSR